MLSVGKYPATEYVAIINIFYLVPRVQKILHGLNLPTPTPPLVECNVCVTGPSSRFDPLKRPNTAVYAIQQNFIVITIQYTKR